MLYVDVNMDFPWDLRWFMWISHGFCPWWSEWEDHGETWWWSNRDALVNSDLTGSHGPEIQMIYPSKNVDFPIGLLPEGTLRETNIPMENDRIFNGKIPSKWQFSRAMLNYQRIDAHYWTFGNALGTYGYTSWQSSSHVVFQIRMLPELRKEWQFADDWHSCSS